VCLPLYIEVDRISTLAYPALPPLAIRSGADDRDQCPRDH
jgi:hypothetical protein